MEKLKPEYTFTEELKTKVESILSQLKQESPEAFEDGQINFDILKDLIGVQAIDDEAPEHFGLNWPGKRQARRLASLPPKGTLKPCIGEGINEETTDNIFIEGENLEVLKILRKSYKGKVKMFFIDPPYNTGNDFIYKDDFSEPLEDYLRKSGQKSEEGLLTTNPLSQGRFHTNWLSFLYPRLRVAKDLLTDDGLIFVSIDYHEFSNLRQLMNEIYGEENLIAELIWDKNHSAQAGIFKYYHEYVLVFAKNITAITAPKSKNSDLFEAGAMKKESERHAMQKFKFPKGTRFDALDGFELTGSWGDTEKVNLIEGRMLCQNGVLAEDVTLEAGFTQLNQMKQYFYGDRDSLVDSRGQKVVEFYFSSSGKIKVVKSRGVVTPQTTLNTYGNQGAISVKLAELFGTESAPFDSPKNPEMLKDFIQWFTNENDIIIDFFAGSGTTGHSVLELLNDDIKRSFICVQIEEKVDTSKPSGKIAVELGLNYVSDVAKRRLELLCNKLNIDSSLQLGFRKYKLDRSNIKSWQDVQPNIEYRGNTLFSQLEQQNQQPIIENTKPEDLITEFMLVEGFPLHSIISKVEGVNGNTVFKIIESDIPYTLFICLDDIIESSTISKLPITSKDTFICLDRSFNGNDQIKMQLDDICKLKTV